MQANISQDDINIVNKIISAKTAYEVLGIESSFILHVDYKNKLKKLYHKLSLKVHPDKNFAPRSTEAFKKLNESYNAVKDGKTIDYNVNKIATRSTTSSTRSTTSNVFSTFNTNNKPNKPYDPDDFINEFFNNMKSGKSNKSKSKPQGKFWDDGYSYNYTNTSTSTKDNNKDKTNEAPKVPKIPCAAKTKNGQACKKNAKEDSKYCTLHQDFDPSKFKPTEKPTPNPQCAALTKSGDRCKKPSKSGSNFCNIHAKPSNL